jgi:hypothetical protein
MFFESIFKEKCDLSSVPLLGRRPGHSTSRALKAVVQIIPTAMEKVV